MSQPFSLSITAQPPAPKLSKKPNAARSASSEDEEMDFISSISNGHTVSVYASFDRYLIVPSQLFRNKKERKKDLLVVPMDIPEYDESRPLLLQKRAPGLDDIEDEEEKYKMDVASRPDSCSIENYDETPVSLFGAGYLRRLGWEEGAPIGKSNRAYVPPFTVELTFAGSLTL
jgi:hypothetical protein